MTLPQANLFDYFSAFVSVVLGLAVADIAHSVHRLLVARKRVNWSPLPLLSALVVFTLIIAYFLRLWEKGLGISEISFYRVALEAAYVLLLFLVAAATLPDEIPPEGLDLQAWYMENRAYLFWLAAVVQVWNLVDFVVHFPEHAAKGEAVPMGDWMAVTQAIGAMILTVVLARSSRRWLHGIAFVGILILAHFGFRDFAIGYVPD